MDYKIIIRSLSEHSEIEWEETFEAPTRKGARCKATKWTNKALFGEEKEAIVKEVWNTREYWMIEE